MNCEDQRDQRRASQPDTIDSFRIEMIARKALSDVSLVTHAEILKLATSVLAHIEQYPEDKNYLHYVGLQRRQPLSLW